jgi:hypothetical protein
MVAAMEGLVGDPGGNPDLTPTATTTSGRFDRGTELIVGVRHPFGGVIDGLQEIIRRTLMDFRLDLGPTLRVLK